MLTLISLVLCLSHKCEPSSSSLSSVPFLDREYCTDQTELSAGRGTILNFHVFVEDFILVYYFPRQRARDCKWQLPIKLNDYSSTQRLFLLADTAIFGLVTQSVMTGDVGRRETVFRFVIYFCRVETTTWYMIHRMITLCTNLLSSFAIFLGFMKIPQERYCSSTANIYRNRTVFVVYELRARLPKKYLILRMLSCTLREEASSGLI